MGSGNLFVIVDSISCVICTSNSCSEFIGALNVLKAQLLSRMERRQWRRYRPTVKNRFFGRLAYYYGHTDTLRSCLSIVLSFFFLPLSLFFFKNFSTSVFLFFFFSQNERHVFQASLHASLVPNRKKRILQINRGVEREREGIN